MDLTPVSLSQRKQISYKTVKSIYFAKYAVEEFYNHLWCFWGQKRNVREKWALLKIPNDCMLVAFSTILSVLSHFIDSRTNRWSFSLLTINVIPHLMMRIIKCVDVHIKVPKCFFFYVSSINFVQYYHWLMDWGSWRASFKQFVKVKSIPE